MKKLYFHHRAETLLEVIIALSVLMITLSYSASVITSGISQLGRSHNRVIATSLAKEGLEAMRNIIGTNLFRFNENQKDCWNAGKIDAVGIVAVDGVGECIPVNKIGDPTDMDKITAFRLIFKREDGIFTLAQLNANPTDTWMTPDFALYLVHSNGQAIGADEAIGEENIMYVDSANAQAAESVIGLPQPRYYRALRIQYRDADTMQITSTVAWGARPNESVSLSTVITSFMQ